jgi:hypothetical protein
MMIDLTGSEKTTYNTFVARAIADDRRPPPPRIRALDALVAELEPRPPSPSRCCWRQGPTIGQGEIPSDDRDTLIELNAESFLEQPAVRRLRKHCRWAKPACHSDSAAVPVSVAGVLEIRHLPASNIGRSAIARLCQRQTIEAAPIVQRGARR